MTRIFVFPGQGAQRVGMGADLFDRFPELEAEASDVLGYSVRRLCLEDPEGQLGYTRYTQPMMYVVNALAHRAAIEKDGPPDIAAGHSLGEYNALEAAGAFGFADGLRLVAARARAMARITGGGMSAVVGMREVLLRFLLIRAGFDTLDLANLNTGTQIVLAGPVQDLDEVGLILEDAGARMVTRLKVSGPFHSRYMAPAAAELAPALRSVRFGDLAFPVVANRTAQPYERDRMADLLIEQIDHPVLWRDTLERLLALPDPQFTEVGDSRVLTSMVRGVRRDLQERRERPAPPPRQPPRQPPRHRAHQEPGQSTRQQSPQLVHAVEP